MERSKKRQQVLDRLLELAEEDVSEQGHAEADELILGLIRDAEIRDAWDAVGKWYA